MRISNFNIENFRNIKRMDASFGAINIFTGKNSSGKSNLLLALTNCLRTEPDFATEFSDNIVTHGKGMSKTVFRTTISDINLKTIIYEQDTSLYFAPEKFSFENSIAKRNSTSLSHKISYWGEFSMIESSDIKRDFSSEEQDFKKSSYYTRLDDEIVYEKNFEEQIESRGGKDLIKTLDAKRFENQDNYFSLFNNYSSSVHSWVKPKEFSSSLVYKYVTETYDSDVYEQVVNRINQKETELFRGRSYTPFQKSKFIFLLADVQKNSKQRDLFTNDLNLYTDGIVKNVVINMDGSQGTKGEIWVDSARNPKDISSISAGTAVLIYFILLKNWVQLSLEERSFKAPEVMIFDEVDSIIHPSLMNNFFEVLNSISRKVQLFITTHSPHFIDCFNREQVFWLRDTTIDTGQKISSNVLSYEEILNKLTKNTDFFKKETNSKLFIDGLLDSIFPNIHE